MASALPAKIKTPEIARYAARAAQLEKYKPIVSYWLEYKILQDVLAQQLHTADEACQDFAIQLMDKLEQTKTENATNDAITDDVAAKAYIENFALETFQRGDDAQRTNRVTRQTADTFQAAATFLDLLTIWAPLDAEAAAKSKFAKFHALRIAKALKAGEDPNETNPVVEEPKAADGEEEASIEQELKDLERGGSQGESDYRPPTVEDVDHHNGMPMPRQADSNAPAEPPQNNEVSPIEQTSSASADRQGSMGGGYFPTLPDAPSTQYTADPPNVAPDLTDIAHQPPPSSMQTAQSFYAPAPPAVPAPTVDPLGQTPAAYQPPAAPVPGSFAAPSAPPPGGYRTDDDSVLAAQKHAKWAISALNFEDVGTAVKELREALRSLGAE